MILLYLSAEMTPCGPAHRRMASLLYSTTRLNGDIRNPPANNYSRGASEPVCSKKRRCVLYEILSVCRPPGGLSIIRCALLSELDQRLRERGHVNKAKHTDNNK